MSRFKHMFTFILISLVLTSGAVAAAEGRAFYVSPLGHDSNAGSKENPFKTISRARDAVRVVNKKMTSDIHVYLRSGDFPVTNTLTFTPDDSGMNGHRIVYQSYGNEVPVLNGAVQVTGWNKGEGRIYQAKLNQSSKLRTLIVNDKRAYMAHKTVSARGGWGSYTVTAGQADWARKSGSTPDGVDYAVSDVPSLTNASDVEIMRNTTWNSNIVCVRDLMTSGDSRILKLQQPYGAIALNQGWDAGFSPKGSHTIYNAFEFLDEPGEFYFNKTTGILYYYSNNENMATAEVFAPHVGRLISVVGASRTQRVANISFKGITFANTESVLPRVENSSGKATVQAATWCVAFDDSDWHNNQYRAYDTTPCAIEVSSADSIRFENCTLKHIGNDGIGFINDVSNSHCIGNFCVDIGGSAFQVGHPQHLYEGDGGRNEKYSPAEEGICRNILIKNNVLFDLTKLFYGHAGITAYFVDGLRIDNNHIQGTQYSAVSLGWGWNNFDELSKPGHPTTTCKNNTFNNNRVYDCMQMLHDGGAFYTLGSQPNSEASGNYVKAATTHFQGVYHPDEGTAWYTGTNLVFEIVPGQDNFELNDWKRKHDNLYSNIYSTSNSQQIGAPNCTITDLHVIPSATWPEEALAIIRAAGPELHYHALLERIPGVVFEPAKRYDTQDFPFKNSKLSLEQRLDDLLGRLTLSEKVSLLSETAPAIERLGIGKYNHGNEALHGVVRPGNFTVFPRPMGLGATFNPELVLTMADCISDEARARYNELGRTCDTKDGSRFGGKYNGLLTFWSPTVNMARDPRWGRTGETYGEDPLLTYRMGAAFTRGLQGDPAAKYLKAVATPKHYAANNEEHNRFSCNAVVPERSLREYYLKGFEGCVVKGKAKSIMAAYNAINGIPCSVNKKLLSDILREEWGFDGYAVGDLWSPKFVFTDHKFTRSMPETAALLIKSGLDLDSGFEPFGFLEEAIQKGLCTEQDVNRSVRRILKARFKLGMYDPVDDVPYNAIKPDIVGCAKHQQVALELARQSMVLLKNEAAASTQKPLLPFGSGVKKVALAGPCVNMYKHPHYSVEDSSATPAITPASGIRAACKARGLELVELDWEKVSGGKGELLKIASKFLTPSKNVDGKAQGLLGEYFNDQFKSAPFGVRVDGEIDFDRTGKAPDSFYNQNPLYIRWSGKIQPPVTGRYTLAFTCDDGARLWLDGQQQVDLWEVGPARTRTFERELQAGKPVDIRIEYFDVGGGAVAKLAWSIPGGADHALDAITKELDAVILVMGLDDKNNGEGKDKTDLNLPKEQAEFIRKMAARNPNIVLVLMSCTVLTINWEKENLPAILEAWYPGEKTGQALSEILWGDVNPSGKLPLTFCKSADDLPPFNDYDISKGRTYQYSTAEPLFEFGYGLSYTKFAYSDLKLSKAVYAEGETLKLDFALKNIGGMAGDEVAQLYVKSVDSKIKMPLKQLKGFKRVALKRGEQKRVSVEIPVSEISYYDVTAKRFVVLKGAFDVEVGSSSKDIRLTQRFTIR